jgi:hypothetical protein
MVEEKPFNANNYFNINADDDEGEQFVDYVT